MKGYPMKTQKVQNKRLRSRKVRKVSRARQGTRRADRSAVRALVSVWCDTIQAEYAGIRRMMIRSLLWHAVDAGGERMYREYTDDSNMIRRTYVQGIEQWAKYVLQNDLPTAGLRFILEQNSAAQYAEKIERQQKRQAYVDSIRPVGTREYDRDCARPYMTMPGVGTSETIAFGCGETPAFHAPYYRESIIGKRGNAEIAIGVRKSDADIIPIDTIRFADGIVRQIGVNPDLTAIRFRLTSTVD